MWLGTGDRGLGGRGDIWTGLENSGGEKEKGKEKASSRHWGLCSGVPLSEEAAGAALACWPGESGSG